MSSSPSCLFITTLILVLVVFNIASATAIENATKSLPSRTATQSTSLPPPDLSVKEAVIVLRIHPGFGNTVTLFHNTPVSEKSFTARSVDGIPIGSPASVTVSATIEHREYLMNANRDKITLVSSRQASGRGLIIKLFATTNMTYWTSEFGKGSMANNVNRHFPETIGGTETLQEDVQRTDVNGVATFSNLRSGTCLKNYTLVPIVETDVLEQLLGFPIAGIEIGTSFPVVRVVARTDKCLPFVSSRSVEHLLVEPILQQTELKNLTSNDTIALIPKVVGFRTRDESAADTELVVPGFGSPIQQRLFAEMKDSCGDPLDGFVVVRSSAVTSMTDLIAVGQDDPTHRIATGITSLNIDGSGAITGARLQRTAPHPFKKAPYNATDVLGYPDVELERNLPFSYVATFEGLKLSLNITAIQKDATLNFTFYPASLAPERTSAPSTASPTPTPSATPIPPPPPPTEPPLIDQWVDWVSESTAPCGSVVMPVRVASLGEVLTNYTDAPVTAPLSHLINTTLDTAPDAPPPAVEKQDVFYTLYGDDLVNDTVSSEPQHIELGMRIPKITARQLSTNGALIRFWSDVDVFVPELGGSNIDAEAPVEMTTPQPGQVPPPGQDIGGTPPPPPPGTVDPLDPESRQKALREASYVNPEDAVKYFSFSSTIEKSRAPRGFMYTVGDKNVLVYKRRRVETNTLFNGQSTSPDSPAQFPVWISTISNNMDRGEEGVRSIREAGYEAPADARAGEGILLNDTSRMLMNSTQFYYVDVVILPSENYFTNLHEVINLTLSASMFVEPFAVSQRSAIFEVDPFPITDATLGRRWFGLVAMFGDHINLGTLAIIRHTSSCTVDEGGQLDFVLHPITVGITNDPQRYFIGAVICNASIVLGFTIVYFLVSKFGFKSESNFPHLTLRLSYILYPGTTLGAFACATARQLNPALFYIILIVATILVVLYPLLFLFLSKKARAKWVPVEVDDAVDDRDRHLDPLLRKEDAEFVKQRDADERFLKEMQDKEKGGKGTANEKKERVSLQSQLSKFLTTTGRYVYLHRDHLRFRTTYQYYRGPVSHFGTVELAYSLLCAACIFADCPLNTMLTIAFISLHLLILFIVHPYFSVGRNLFAMCVDIMFLAGTITYSRGSEATARTIFDTAEFFGSSLNILGLMWAGWVSLTWRKCVLRLELYGLEHNIGCLAVVFGRIRQHLDVLSGIDPAAEFEIFMQKQENRDEEDKKRRRAASRSRVGGRYQRANALDTGGEDFDTTGSFATLLDGHATTAVNINQGCDDEELIPMTPPTTGSGSPQPAVHENIKRRSKSQIHGSLAGGSGGAAPQEAPSPERGGSSDDDKSHSTLLSSTHSSSNESSESDGYQDIIDEIIRNHRVDKEQQRRDAWEEALDAHRRERAKSAGALLQDREFDEMLGPSGSSSFARRSSVKRRSVGPKSSFKTRMELELEQQEEERRKQEEEAQRRREQLDQWQRDEAVEAISAYQKSQQEMSAAYQAARDKADHDAILQEEQKLAFQRRKRRLGVSDANSIVTRMYMTTEGVHEVRKPRPKVYIKDGVEIKQQKKQRPHSDFDLGGFLESSSSSSNGAQSSDEDDEFFTNAMKISRGGGGGGGGAQVSSPTVTLETNKGKARQKPRFGALQKFPNTKRNLVLERMRSQHVQPVQNTSYMYDVL